MSTTVLDQIPVELELSKVLKYIKMTEDHPEAPSIAELVKQAQTIARPEALYKEAYIETRTDESIVAEGITFRSRVLAVNLQNAHRFIAYVVTCGQELETWAQEIPDLLMQYYAERINELVLRQAVEYLNRHLETTFHMGKTAHMSPGSLEDWPISEQKPLFQLLGDTEATIGLRLTDSFLMLPIKSLSGIRFSTTVDYENCMLCPRENCPGRRAPYDPHLYARSYSKTKTV
jgi:hypothetical protein